MIFKMNTMQSSIHGILFCFLITVNSAALLVVGTKGCLLFVQTDGPICCGVSLLCHPTLSLTKNGNTTTVKAEH